MKGLKTTAVAVSMLLLSEPGCMGSVIKAEDSIQAIENQDLEQVIEKIKEEPVDLHQENNVRRLSFEDDDLNVKISLYDDAINYIIGFTQNNRVFGLGIRYESDKITRVIGRYGRTKEFDISYDNDKYHTADDLIIPKEKMEIFENMRLAIDKRIKNEYKTRQKRDERRYKRHREKKKKKRWRDEGRIRVASTGHWTSLEGTFLYCKQIISCYEKKA